MDIIQQIYSDALTVARLRNPQPMPPKPEVSDTASQINFGRAMRDLGHPWSTMKARYDMHANSMAQYRAAMNNQCKGWLERDKELKFWRRAYCA